VTTKLKFAAWTQTFGEDKLTIMLAISALGTAFAAANSVLSVRVAESVTRDLSEVLLRKIQT